MPKLRVMSGRECREILEANGFVFVHHRGSHMKLQVVLDDGAALALGAEPQGYGTPVAITAKSVLSTRLAKGTLSKIIRQSGLGRDLFES